MTRAITNQTAFEAAQQFFPGGVNSPVRAFRAVGGTPPFFSKGSGARVTDVEGNVYIDYVGSWGPLILGHADPEVLKAVSAAAADGMTFGAPTVRETELARIVQRAFPSIERMRLVSSGTEATMAAIRLARGFTGRSLLIKCEGCYHGHGDSLLVDAGSGVATLGIPGCPGIIPATAAATLTVPFNNLTALEEAFQTHRRQVAGFIIEPVCGNMGVVYPEKGYLQAVRELTRREGALLIFDEVMTGFRGGFGGVQNELGITPDLTCLGKIVGGGLPLAIYGGSRDVMSKIAPEGPIYQAGTLSGNPVAVASGMATLTRLEEDKQFYPRLMQATDKLVNGLQSLFKGHQLPVGINRWGSMFTVFFTAGKVKNYLDAKTCDTTRFSQWHRGMLKRGIYLPPSQFEAAFVSIAHGEAEIEATLQAAKETLEEL